MGRIVAALRRHLARTVVAAVVLAALGAFGLYWFAPWNLFIDKRVDEALPGVEAPVETPVGEEEDPGGGGGAAEEEGSPGRITLARGVFRSLEHGTSGTALVVELADGSRFLRLEDLDTSNGPDLRVYLSSIEAQDDWYVYDDGELVDLGALKGNLGSSNYEIPQDVDLSAFRTAVVWCRRFSVGFGVAPLNPPG